MQHTTIEWARNPDGSPGYSLNPITGCLGGCSYCWARKLANSRLHEHILSRTKQPQVSQVYPDADLCYMAAGAVPGDYSNPFYPIVTKDLGEEVLTATRSEAEVLSGHTAVVWLKGITGCYMLDRVKVRRCRACGCTTFRACLVSTEQGIRAVGCHWVEKDLCSECVGQPRTEETV